MTVMVHGMTNKRHRGSVLRRSVSGREKRRNTRETEDDRLIFRDKCPCRPPRIQLGVRGILFALLGEK